MKFLTLWILFCVAHSPSISAETPTDVVDAQTINVDGYIAAEKPLSDPELETIHAEIKRQKVETSLNKEKAKNFKELKKSVEQLSETTEEYLEEKKAAKNQIAEYNEKVKCLQAEAPGHECDKYLRRR